MANGTTTTDRWSCFVYPRRMYPDGVVERPISVLFEDECGHEGTIAALNLTPSEARDLAKALERAAWEREAVPAR